MYFVLTQSATFLTDFDKICLKPPFCCKWNKFKRIWKYADFFRLFPYQRFAFQSTKEEMVEKKDT